LWLAIHRQAHDGRPISRDSLKKELGISTDRASSLIRVIRAAAGPPGAGDSGTKPEWAAAGPLPAAA